MKLKLSLSVILSALNLLLPSQGVADSWQAMETVTGVANDTLTEHYSALYPDYDLIITVNSPDPRLKLRQCDKDLTAAPSNLPLQGGNATLQIRCDDATPWSIYVSSAIEIWAPLVITNNSVARGEILTEDNLSTQRTNLAQARKGSVFQISEALGLEARQSLRPHQVLRTRDLVEPMVIRKGDAIQVAAHIGSLRVITPGIALANGRVGQQISVENSRSSRKIRAKVIAEGLVEVPI